MYRLSFVLFFRDGLDTGLRTRKHLKKTNLNAPVYELHGLPCADVLYVVHEKIEMRKRQLKLLASRPHNKKMIH